MMKIGIMTLFDNVNYGATLQAYALQTVIRYMGYECEDIDYVREVNCPQPKPAFSLNILSKKAVQLMHYRIYKQEKAGVQVRRRAFMQFIHQRMQVSSTRYNGHSEIGAAADVYDAFVCGSDNIWNKNLLDTAFFLDFVPDHKKKIAYAPGMSTDTISPEQETLIKPLAMRLDALSVREKSGRDLIAKITGREVFQAVDPTLLIAAEEWRMIEQSVNVPEKYIFCYFFGTNPLARKCANEYAEKSGLPIVTLPMHGRYEAVDHRFGKHRLYDVTPAQFIWLIDHAEIVFTDSFHGTIFSVLLQKDFFCYRRFFDEKTKSLNLRMDSLLATLGIKGRIIETHSGYVDNHDAQIDYAAATRTLKRKRAESLDYLKKALSD